MRPFHVLQCAVLLAAIASTNSTQSNAETHGDYRDAIAALYKAWDYDDRPGVAVAILDGGEMVYARGFGMANIEEDVPIGADSMFNIASISKQFTAGTIAKLHLNGQFGLQDTVRKHLPYLPDWADTVTVEQLVHHQSGIPDIFGYMAQNDIEFDHVWGNEDVLPHIAEMKLDFEPGEKYQYSNTNYILLAEVVRHVSGLSLRQYAHEHFFKPLGMTHTRIDDDLSKDQEGLVVGYARPRRNQVERVDRKDVLVGDGNVVTNLNDFAKWDANLRDPIVGGKEWRDLMLTRIDLNDGEMNSYAFGLIVSEKDGDTVVQHAGSWLRFRSHWIQLRDQGVSVIVFGNHGSQLHAEKVLDIYLGARNATKP